MRNLAEDIINSFDDRSNGLAKLKDTVRKTMEDEQNELKELHNTRMAASEELHEDLAKSATDRKAAVDKELKDSQNELEEFHNTRMAASEELHKDLAKSVADRKAVVDTESKEFQKFMTNMSKKMQADFARDKAKLVKDVAAIKHDANSMLRVFDKELEGVRTDIAGGHDEWLKLAATMQARRGGTTAKVEMPKSAKPQKAGGTDSDFATPGEKVLEFLAKHPKGTKMTQMEQKFGLARIQMAKVVKDLMDEKKVEKRALLYFAV